MIPTSTELAEAIEAADRTIRPVVSVDWDDDGHGGVGTIDDLSEMISSVRLDQTLQTQTPAPVRVVEGSAVCAATVALTGGGIHYPAGSVDYHDVSSATTDGTSTSISASPPAACRAGDYLVAQVSVAHGAAHVQAVPMWTLLGEARSAVDAGVASHLYGRWATEADADGETTYTWQWEPDLAASASAVVVAVGGTTAHQPGTLGVHAAGIAHTAGSGTGHPTPTLATTVDGCRLVSFWAYRVATTGGWTAPGGQTELADVRGTHGSVNVQLAAATSTAVVDHGEHALVGTSATATALATMAVVALAPVGAGDERRSAAAHYARANPRSPLAGKERIRRPITVDVEVQTADGPQTIRRMTGLTRRLTTTAAGRVADLDALDYRELLRDQVELIPTLGTKAGADGTWIVFQALYACGVYAGPVPRAAGSLLWIPAYGSLNPVTDQRDPAWTALILSAPNDTAGAVRPKFAAGPYVLAVDGLYHTSDLDYRRAFVNTFYEAGQLGWDGETGRVEAWVLGVDSPTTGTAGTTGRVYVYYTDNLVSSPAVRVGVRHNSKLFYDLFDTSDVLVDDYESTLTVPDDGGWHFVGIHWDHGAQELTFRVDDTEETVATTITGAQYPADTTRISVVAWSSLSDLHLHGPLDVTEPWLSEDVTVAAVLDQSTVQLTASYEGRKREAWELITEVAAAELAVAMWDEDGIFRYRTRRRLVEAEALTVQRTLLAERSLTELADSDGVDTVRNIIQISFRPVTPAEFYNYVYTDTTIRTLPPGTTLDVEIAFSSPVFILSEFALPLSVASAEFATLDPYLALTLNSDGTHNAATDLLLDSVTADVVEWTATTALLRVTSTAAVHLYIAGIGLAGMQVHIGNEVQIEVRDQQSIDRYGAQLLTVPTSQWVQRRDIAEQVARSILADTRFPVPAITRLEIVADPRLQIGDRIRIADTDGVGLAGEYWITGFPSEEFGPGYRQSIAARPAANQFLVGTGLVGIDLIGGD